MQPQNPPALALCHATTENNAQAPAGQGEASSRSRPGAGPRVNLLGRPSIDGQRGSYRMRSRKSWALLAYLVLSERPPTRTTLAALLFGEADDPLGALRWSLSEVRRALAGDVTIEGDPVVLTRHPDLTFDVDVLARGAWACAVRLPGLGADLLEGLTVSGAGAFESWLLSEQRRLSAVTRGVLDDAVHSSSARGDYDAAIGYAVRRVTATPLDEEAHSGLIRLYRRLGDEVGAQRHYLACTRVLERELGVRPGPLLRAALREPLPTDLAS
jgi:DNA-binding SARP family transcriptional activator